jgi:autotransporter-associated beta strand protein
VANNVGAAVQIDGGAGGLSIAEPLTLNNTGFSNAGALQSLAGAGTNLYTGLITLGSASTIGADTGSILEIRGGIAGAQALTLAANGTINITTTALAAALPTSITKIGAGTVNLQVASGTYTGPLTVNQGTFSINGAGALGATGAVTVNPAATLTINSSAAAATRLGARPLTLTGGHLNYTGFSTAFTETVGATTFGRGQSVVTITPGAAGSGLAFGAVTRNTGATATFTGNLLGTAAGANVATLASTTTGFSFVGQTGATATTSKSIIPWALVTSGGTTNFATADAAAAATTSTAIVRQLAIAGTEGVANLFTTNTNVRLTSTPAALAIPTTVNSLTIETGGGVTINPLITMTLSSGGVLAKDSATISGGILTSVGNESIFHVLGGASNLNVSSVVAGTGGITKSSNGILTLSNGTSAYTGMSGNVVTGTVNIVGGTLRLGAGVINAIPANTFIELTSGGTLDLNGTSQYAQGVFSDGTLPGMGGKILGTASTGTLVINNDNNARTFAGTFEGALTVARTGSNTLSLTNSSPSFTGNMLLNNAITTLADSGALTGMTGA